MNGVNVSVTSNNMHIGLFCLILFCLFVIWRRA